MSSEEWKEHTMLPDKDGPAVGGGQTSDEEDPSVSLFREYLRLRTVHPEPDYGERPSCHFTDLQTRPSENVTLLKHTLLCTLIIFLSV